MSSVLKMKKTVRLALHDREFRRKLLENPGEATQRESRLGFELSAEAAADIIKAADNIRFAGRQADEAVETLAIGIIFDYCFPNCRGAEAMLKTPPRISVEWEPQGSVQRMIDAGLRLDRSSPELIAGVLEAAARAVEAMPAADDSTCGPDAAATIREHADQIRQLLLVTPLQAWVLS